MFSPKNATLDDPTAFSGHRSAAARTIVSAKRWQVL